MAITYTHYSSDTHDIISGSTVTVTNTTITFSELKKVNGNVLSDQSFSVTSGFPSTFTGKITDDDPTGGKNDSTIEGFFIQGTGNAITGAIRRTHKTPRVGDESDIGIFSGTHNM